MIEAAERALKCLGRGFDVASDFRPKHCKGKERLVLLNDEDSVEISVPGGGGILRGVSVDIKCGKGERVRYQSDVLEFNRMSEWFNQRSGISGKIPSGMFNTVFGFNGSSWAEDAAKTKSLAMDGHFITLFDLRIHRQPLILCDEVIDAVPSTWDPASLARFIENYGTHIIVGLSVGGQDVVYVRQDQPSNLSNSELKQNLDQLGDQFFNGACTLHPLHYKSKDYKPKIAEAFDVFDPQRIMVDGFTNVSCKNGLAVVCTRRGGDASASSHYEWLLTLPSMPEIINFIFVPITSLMKGVAGAGFLAHAINLYLRYKPPVTELQHFLEFQSHRSWAPLLNDHPLGPSSNRCRSTTSLQISLMGPKLHISTSPVIIPDLRPVTGMRLHLEGKKTNCLAIHLQHLCTTPTLFTSNPNSTAAALRWHGSDAAAAGNDNYYEPLDWRRLFRVCTAPVEPDPGWLQSQSNLQQESAYVVAGAKLHMEDGSLHLRLLFAELPGCITNRSVWYRGPQSSASGFLQRSGIMSGVNSAEREEILVMPMVVVDSGVFAAGPPAAGKAGKLKKYVDMSERCKGPGDSPGYWLATGAKLELEKGRIGLHVRFSLLTLVSLSKTSSF